MPSINMIAPRRAEMSRLELGMRRLLLLIFAEVVVALAIAAVFSAQIVATKGRAADLNAELAKLEPIVNKIEFYEKATASIQPKVDILDTARDHTMRWHRMLGMLSTAVPSDTWLTRIAASPSAKDPNQMTVNLNGVSTNQNLIGDTMLRLNSYEDFDHVDLHYTQKTSVGKREVIEFEVGAGLKTSENPKGATNANERSNNG